MAIMRRTPEPPTKQQLLAELQARIDELSRSETVLMNEEAALYAAGVRVPETAPEPDPSEARVQELMNGFWQPLPAAGASPGIRLADVQAERQHTKAAIGRLTDQEWQLRSVAFAEAWASGMSVEWAQTIREGATLVAGIAAWEKKRDAARARAQRIGNLPYLPADRYQPLLRADYRTFLEAAVAAGIAAKNEVLP